MMKNEVYEEYVESNEMQVDEKQETSLHKMQQKLGELVKQRDQINQDIYKLNTQIHVCMEQVENNKKMDLSLNECDQEHLKIDPSCTQSCICSSYSTFNSKTIELVKKLIYVATNWKDHQRAIDGIQALESYSIFLESQFNEMSSFSCEQEDPCRIQSQLLSYSISNGCPFYDELIYTREKLNNEKKAFINEILKMQTSCKEVKAASYDAVLATRTKELSLLNLSFKVNKANFFVLFLLRYIKNRMHGNQDLDNGIHLKMKAWMIWRKHE